MNTSIATLLERKGGAVHTVPMTVTVAEAVKAMNYHRVGSVLVTNGTKLAGIFTERDVLRRVVGAELDPLTTPVAKVMTGDVMTIGPEATVQQVMEVFAERRIRHLPVMNGDRLLGLVSIGDVSRWVASMHRAEADSLRQYITGDLSA